MITVTVRWGDNYADIEFPCSDSELQAKLEQLHPAAPHSDSIFILSVQEPIGRICRTKDLTCFHLEDRLDEVRELVLKHRESCYPILDADEKVVGVLTRYHLLRPRRKRVVLVDHNEAAQSVPGLEEAEIVEIIDHHRVADIQTNSPIYVRNEPVGSTNTIIAGMFQDKGLIPSEKLAGLIAAAILSDTVMFKSPIATMG